MNKQMLVAAAIGLATLTVASPALASSTTVPAVPTQCVSPAPANGKDFVNGPARSPHTAELPACDTISGICVILVPGQDAQAPGPSRAVHTPRVPVDPCTGVDPACQFTLHGQDGQVVTTSTITGPSRATHSPAGVDTVIVDITDACQTILTESISPIPKTGSNSTPIVLLATAFVLAGGIVLVGQRRLARR